MKADDVFVDIGCGKGRVVCCACRTSIRKVVAIELNGSLLKQTMDNVAKLRGRRCPVEAISLSAEEYDYTDATIAYLYNPFNARLTERVMEKLYYSYSKLHRPLRVVYANPIHEHVLRKYNFLEKYEEWPASDFPVFGCAVSFWRTSETQQSLS